jgi:hypothetical protein
MGHDTLPIIAVFSTISWVAWLLFSSIRRYKVAQLQAEIQGRLLQRFDSPDALLGYARSDAGMQFIKSMDRGIGSLILPLALLWSLEPVMWAQQGTGIHAKYTIAYLFHPHGNAIPVHRLQRQGLKHQHLQCSLDQSGRLLRHGEFSTKTRVRATPLARQEEDT